MFLLVFIQKSLWYWSSVDEYGVFLMGYWCLHLLFILLVNSNISYFLFIFWKNNIESDREEKEDRKLPIASGKGGQWKLGSKIMRKNFPEDPQNEKSNPGEQRRRQIHQKQETGELWADFNYQEFQRSFGNEWRHYNKEILAKRNKFAPIPQLGSWPTKTPIKTLDWQRLWVANWADAMALLRERLSITLNFYFCHALQLFGSSWYRAIEKLFSSSLNRGSAVDFV